MVLRNYPTKIPKIYTEKIPVLVAIKVKMKIEEKWTPFCTFDEHI